MQPRAPKVAVEEKEICVEMLSINCIDPAKARIKIYGKTNDSSFANVRDIYTMGGKRGGEEVSEGLVAPKEFWKRLLGLPDD